MRTMPAKPLTPEQLQDAARLKAAFHTWKNAKADRGEPISQHEVAERLGFSQPALSQYLNGKIPLNGPAVAKFAGLIDVRPEDISPAIAQQEQQRARTWSPTENALEQVAVDLFVRAGVQARRTEAADRSDLQPWFAEYLPSYTPDLRLDFEDGSVAWVEVKTPHAVSPRAQNYVLAQAHHPGDFLLLMAEPPDMPRIIDGWLERRRAGPEAERTVKEAAAEYGATARKVWVRGTTFDVAQFAIDDPRNLATEYADVTSNDPQAFVCRVVGDSMVPRYMPGEYVLVEPGTEPEIEDDVLVQLKSGKRLLKRLAGRRGGIRLAAYNSQETQTYQQDDIQWMSYVAHAVSPRRIHKSATSEAVGAPIASAKASVVERGSARVVQSEAEPGARRVSMRRELGTTKK